MLNTMCKKLLTYIAIVAIVAGCSNARVTTDYETVYDFSSLQTFYVLPADKKVFDNPKVSQIDVKRIGAIVPKELAKKYRPVAEKSQADFWVRYFLVVEEKMRVDNYNANFGFYRFGWGYRYGFDLPMNNVANSYYERGSVIIDIIDAKTEEVVWRGVTEGRVNRRSTPEVRRIRLARNLERLFSTFPPQ